MKLKIFILIFISHLSIKESFSQILNIEDPTLPIDSIANHDLKFGFGLSGNISKQKDLVYDATVLSECVYHHNDRHQFLLNGQYIYSGSNTISLINSSYVYLRYTPFFQRRFAPQLFSQFQTDRNRGLIARQLIGGNIRLDILKSENAQIQIASGIFQEYETWNKYGNENPSFDQIQSDKFKLNQSIRLFYQYSQNAEITWNQFFQLPVDFHNQQGFRWSNQISLSFPVSEHFKMQYNISSMYDSKPIIHIPHFYFNSAFGITFNN